MGAAGSLAWSIKESDVRVHKVVVVEDHLMQRKYVTALLNHQPDLRVVFACEELPELMEWMETAGRNVLPDLVLLDLMVDRRPHADPRMVAKLLAHHRYPGPKVVLFSALTSPPLARRMIQTGVHGAIGKRDSEASILQAVRAVLNGEWWVSPELAELIADDPKRPALSEQEERALALYASGSSIEEVAAAIGVKTNTVKKYLQRVRNKYAAAQRPLNSRLDLAKAAADDGYLAVTG